VIRTVPSTTGTDSVGTPPAAVVPRFEGPNTNWIVYRSANATPILVIRSVIPSRSRIGSNTSRSITNDNRIAPPPATTIPPTTASGVAVALIPSAPPKTEPPAPTSNSEPTFALDPNPPAIRYVVAHPENAPAVM